MILTSCTSKPVIPISNTLEIELNDRYPYYVKTLNNAASGDTVALTNFLMIKEIYDGATYDHGWVLIELMKKNGDKQFSDAIQKIDRSQKMKLNTYFHSGLDFNNEANILFKQYPITFEKLGFSKKDELE